MIAGLAIPLVAFQVWWGMSEFQRAEDSATTEALRLAELSANSVERFLSLSEQLVNGVAVEYGERLLDAPETCEAEIREVNAVLPFLLTLTVVGADGLIVCSAQPVPPGVDGTTWTTPGRVAAAGTYVIGDPIMGSISEQWVLPLGAPVFGADGVLRGTVIGSVPLLELSPLLGGGPEIYDQLISVATEDRVIVARSEDAETFVGQPLPEPTGEDHEVAPGHSVARGPDLDGIDRAWGQVQLANGWIAYVGVPEALILAPARAAFARRMGIIAVILLAAVVFSGVRYRRIAGALQELTRRVRVVGIESRIDLPPGTPTEVRTVVEQFSDTLSSQHRAEAAERAARERYQSIFENAVFGLYVSTPDGRFLEVNAALSSMLGYESPEALMNTGPAALYTAPHVRDELIQTAREGRPIDGWEVTWLRADGNPIIVRLSGRTITAPDGTHAFEMIVEDITEAKRTESELRQIQKMEAIGKLAGGIAHDFNNLLTIIGGNLEMIDDTLEEDAEVRPILEQIRGATTRAGALTAQLLAFARRDPRGARPVLVDSVLRDIEQLLMRLIGEHIVLDWRLSASELVVSIDPGELEQIVMNLVLNARDALPFGGRVILETRRHTDQGGTEGVLLSVTDDGVGMDSDTSKRIFEPFYTTKPTGQGTGLGLSTVYGIVQRAHGHIEVHSAPDEGTTVQVWFPISADRVPREQTEPETPALAGGDETILVVEDEELLRAFVRRALGEAGYHTLEAADGEGALRILEHDHPPVDLVLTDVVMPRLSGPELAERLEVIAPDTPVLFMSGYLRNHDVSGRLERPDAVLRKPFSASELRYRVRRAIDRTVLGESRG